MASPRGSASKREKVALKSKVTANQLGIRVCTLVLYKKNPYHVVCIDKTGTELSIKKCENANKVRDVSIYDVKVVGTDDPLFKKWGLEIPKSFNRTKEHELYVIKALVDSTHHSSKDARRDVLISMLEKHPWLGVWLRACYALDRNYRLKPKHLRKVANKPRSKSTYGIFELLTKLQFNKLEPVQAAVEWLSMIEEWDEDVRPIANMVLERQFGEVTYEDARFAMKKCKNLPVLPKRDLGE